MRDEKKPGVVETIDPDSFDSVSNFVPTVETLTDSLENVRILMNEGFLKDAKKILHHMIREDPRHSSALQMLAEIQKIEIQNVFSHGVADAPFDHDQKLPQEKQIDLEALLQQLDEMYQLGVGTSE